MTSLILIWSALIVCHVLLEHMTLGLRQEHAYFLQYLEDMRLTRSRLLYATSLQEVEQIYLEMAMIGRSYDLWVESRR